MGGMDAASTEGRRVVGKEVRGKEFSFAPRDAWAEGERRGRLMYAHACA